MYLMGAPVEDERLALVMEGDKLPTLGTIEQGKAAGKRGWIWSTDSNQKK